MSDFVDRVLGLPDPSAVRPRPPSFLDLPPVFDPPPPGAGSEEPAAGSRPSADAGTTEGARVARTGPAVPAALVRVPAPYAPAAPGASVRGGLPGPGRGLPSGPAEAAPRAAGTGPGPSPAAAGAAPRPDGPDLTAGSGAPVAARPGRTPAPAAQPRAAAGPGQVPEPAHGYGYRSGETYGGPRAGRGREPDGSAAGPVPGETTVHITIGRLEVRSGPPRPASPDPAPAVRRPPRAPAVPLEDYLRRRSGGGR
ncbi:hypothetical protein ACFZBM_22445 [Streptomyces lavendulae]|uniref:hypothetical protein n=1 Tax=Streptomyces lavendulae TaxID=1914 RepID=UPI0036EA3676